MPLPNRTTNYETDFFISFINTGIVALWDGYAIPTGTAI